jgi:hypothetical protein
MAISGDFATSSGDAEVRNLNAALIVTEDPFTNIPRLYNCIWKTIDPL